MRTLSILAAALLGLLASPASAEPHADRAEPVRMPPGRITGWVGYSCGLAAANDPVGVLVPNPDQMVGMVTFGPVQSLDPVTHQITMVCQVQLDSPVPGFNVRASASWTTGGATLANSSFITYLNRYPRHGWPGDVLYLCTYLYGATSTGYFEHQHDADPATPGVQCPAVTSTSISASAAA